MRISVRELKARTGDIMRAVEEGKEVVLTKRGKPAARIVPIEKQDFDVWWEELKQSFRRNRFRNADEAIKWMKGS
jgi:prevent-host-death family protein